MKVREIMTTEVRTCAPDTNLCEAAGLMLDGDCGILPVVDQGRVVGVVTDRDLFIALGTRNRLPGEIHAEQVMRTPVHSCQPDDDVQEVLAAMKQYQVHRIPVEGFGGTLAGIVSLNDIALAAGPRKAVRDADVAETLRAVCAHHHPQPRIAAA